MPEKLQHATCTSDDDVVMEESVDTDEEISRTASKEEATTPRKYQDITYKRDRGIMKKIIKPGVSDESPPSGVTVKVQFTGKLEDGTIFETTWAEPCRKDDDDEEVERIGKPFEFELGVGTKVIGWDMCVASMKKREIASFRCKSEYAVGAPSSVPPDTALFYEIELISWDSDLTKEKDGGVLKTVMLKAGQGYVRPKEGDTVQLHIIGRYNGKRFESRDVTFPLGEGAEYDICEGIEIALPSFMKEEKSRLEIKAKYAFGATGKAEYDIPPNADVQYTITLKSFERLQSPYSLQTVQNIKQAEEFKDKGTEYFKEGKLPLAVKLYKRIEDYVGKEYRTNEELHEKCWRKDLMVAMHLNLALCYLKLNEDKDAKEQCDKALDLEPNNEKALFRRGQSYMSLREPKLALADFERVARLNPKNGSAIKNAQRCKEMMDEQRTQEKKLYSSMF